mmetsp:Transcript_20629/g.30531  ORF Transcript_20629/g.30531 Transcript_20629/m.30531 type:complete len:293 (-) Transcript_20629:77-955(-)
MSFQDSASKSAGSFRDLRSNKPRSSSNISPKPPKRGGGFGEMKQNNRFNSCSEIGSQSVISNETKDLKTAKISEALTEYAQNLTILHRLVQTLGTIKDTSELRKQFNCQQKVVEEKGRSASNELTSFLALLDSNNDEIQRKDIAKYKAAHSKLNKDYNRAKIMENDLKKEGMRRIKEKDTKQNEIATVEAANQNSEETNVQELRQKQILQAQLAEEELNQAIIEETEEELGQINKSLHAVHDIFRDLALLVSQQQEQVDHIETQTDEAHNKAQEGLLQVQQANHYGPNCLIS